MNNDRMEPGWRELAPATTTAADQPDLSGDGTFAHRLGARAGAAGSALQARTTRLPRLVSALLLVTAVIMVTYAAASALVSGNGALSFVRVSKAMGDAYAAAEYRKARIACQQKSGNAREWCIAQAHADEERARAFAATRRGSEIAFARAAEEARDHTGGAHSVIVDPACNLIAGGRGNLCEIQVGNPAMAGLQATNLIPPSTRLNLAANSRASRTAPAASQGAGGAPLMVSAHSQPAAQSQSRPRRVQTRTEDHIFEMAWSSRQ